MRRPKVDYESRTLGLDRNELGAFVVQAGLGSPRDHALASLLALNGLRISEALRADLDDLDFERGHRTLKIVRKGGKHATIPLAPRTSRAIDLYVGERTRAVSALEVEVVDVGAQGFGDAQSVPPHAEQRQVRLMAPRCDQPEVGGVTLPGGTEVVESRRTKQPAASRQTVSDA